MANIIFKKDCPSGRYKKGQIIECNENFAQRQIVGGYAEKYVPKIQKPVKPKKVKTLKIKENE